MTVERIAVVGAGVMGHGIAQVAAQSGWETTLCDLNEELVERGREMIVANLDKGLELRKLTPEERQATLDNLRTATELADGVEGAELVIEAIPEEMALKRSLFARLDELVPESTIYATNTSSLSVGELAEGLRRPDRFIGMHFFNPVHLMKLLEIVVHDSTAEEILATVRSVGERMGKTPIVVRDVPGFATSRLGVLLGLEAMRMIEQEVATAEDIDAAMELGYRHPMGPLRLTDLVGLDVRLKVAEYLHRELNSEAFRPPDILREMVEQGRLGKKTGQGFYEWPDE